MHKDTRK